jgi:hypothetical protein
MSSTGGTTGTPIGTTQTSLTSAIIDARVRQITRRDSTTELPTADMTNYISEAVREISAKTLSLKDETSGTLSRSTNTISRPSDMIDTPFAIDALYLDDVLLCEITFDEWRAGKLNGYAYRNGTLYVNPTPDNDLSYTLYYRKYHTEAVTTIALSNDLEMAIVFLTASKVYKDRELYDEGELMVQESKRELDENWAPEQPCITQIRTCFRE